MAMVRNVVDDLRIEHTSMERLLGILEKQIEVFEEGDQPDYEIIQDIILSFLDFPDQCHHPERIAYLDNKYRFRNFFDLEVYSYDHHAGKGDPLFLEILLETLGEQPSEILYIDNSRRAIKLAEESGLNVVLYRTGHVMRILTTMQRLGVAVGGRNWPVLDPIHDGVGQGA
jgi:hypothetical protein